MGKIVGKRHLDCRCTHELRDHGVHNEARPREHALVSGSQHRLRQHAEQLIAAIADCDVGGVDTEMLREARPQRADRSVAVDVEVREHGGHRLEGDREWAIRVLVAGQLSDVLALALLANVARAQTGGIGHHGCDLRSYERVEVHVSPSASPRP